MKNVWKRKKKTLKQSRNKLRNQNIKWQNVAIPEIHTKDFDEIENTIDEIEQEKEEKHSILCQ